MRPVPERSHMLKTWPTKAGPPPFPSGLSPVILSVDGSPEPESEPDEVLFFLTDEEEEEADDDDDDDGSLWVGSKKDETGTKSGFWVGLRVGLGRKEDMLVAVVVMKRDKL